MKYKNWFWGIVLILAAVLIFVGPLGYFGTFGIWTILASLLLVALIIYSIFTRNPSGIFIPLSLLYAIYQKPIGLPAINIWLLLLAALLFTCGIEIIFHPHRRKVYYDGHHRRKGHGGTETESGDDNHPQIRASFTEASRYLQADCLENAYFSVAFGSLDLYLDNVQLSPGGAKISVDCSFGALKMYLPKHWAVRDNIGVMLGDVKNHSNLAKPDNGAPEVTLTGNVQFGEISIIYI